MEISLLKPEVCDQVARLHMHYLSTPFRGIAGQKLLNKYYQVVCKERGAVGYIAQKDGEVLGYVCGIWHPDELRKILLRTHWFRLAWWGFCQVLSKPSLLNDFVNRFHSDEQANGLPQEKVDHESYELRPIVVSPAARGSGLALQLVDQLIEDAQARGFHSMYLYTEPDNIPAQRFYGKVGFQEVGQLPMSGRQYLRFELNLYQENVCES